MIEIKNLLHNKYNTLVTFISLTMLQTRIKTIFIYTLMHLKDCLWLNHNTAVHGTAFACLTICLAPYHHWSLLTDTGSPLTSHSQQARMVWGSTHTDITNYYLLVFCDIKKIIKETSYKLK